jgi:hypothetical protein
MKKSLLTPTACCPLSRTETRSSRRRYPSCFMTAGQLKVGVLCHHHVISEFVFVLSLVYGTDTEKIHEILSDLIAMPGITTVSEMNMQTVLSLWPAVIADYGDALIAAYSKHYVDFYIAIFSHPVIYFFDLIIHNLRPQKRSTGKRGRQK